MTTPRSSDAARSRVAVVVSLLSLLVALSAVGYAAGLPRNSVGTPQLKKNAVTTTKIKKGAVTAGRIRPGVLPERARSLNRVLAVGDPPVELRVGGVYVSASCTPGMQAQGSVLVTNPVGVAGRISYGGLESRGWPNEESSTRVSESASALALSAPVTVADGLARVSFSGQVAPVGGPPVVLHVALQADDDDSKCTVQVTAVPTR